MKLTKRQQVQIKDLIGVYSTDELRRIFTKRLDDEMFAQVGKTIVPNARVTPETKPFLVWHGYEFLVQARYFAPINVKGMFEEIERNKPD